MEVVFVDARRWESEPQRRGSLKVSRVLKKEQFRRREKVFSRNKKMQNLFFC
jgi:hypothetical protein